MREDYCSSFFIPVIIYLGKIFMESKILSHGHETTYLLVFQEGDELISTLEKYAFEQDITSGHFEGIGAFKNVVVAFFDWDKKEYIKIPFDEQLEILSFNGDITVEDEIPKIHAHVVCGRKDGSAVGGHLVEGYVRPTLELVLYKSDKHLRRTVDPKTGVHVIDIRSSGD